MRRSLSENELPPKASLYMGADFDKLRADMRKLAPRHLLFVIDCELQPSQWDELEDDGKFVVIIARDNFRGKVDFYCIARSADAEFATVTVTRLIEDLGGTNVTARITH
jgi:hypothetical protein